MTRAAADREGLPGRVLEAGRRFADDDFARTSWDVRRFLLGAELGCYGIQRIHGSRTCLILAGAGVGGGSLVYANTLYEPLDAVLRRPAVARHHRLAGRAGALLRPGQPDARRVTQNPSMTPSDEVMKEVADEMGVGRHLPLTPVGGVLRRPRPARTVPDPFFGGAGPGAHRLHRVRRVHDRLPAQRQEHPGEELPLPRRAARRRGPAADDRHRAAASGAAAAGTVDTVRTGAWLPRAHPAYRHRRRRSCSRPAPRHPAAAAPDARRGPAAAAVAPAGLTCPAPTPSRSSAPWPAGWPSTTAAASRSRRRSTPTPDTHVEPVRYGKGQQPDGAAQTVLTDGDGARPRWRTWLGTMLRDPRMAAAPPVDAALVASAPSSRW